MKKKVTFSIRRKIINNIRLANKKDIKSLHKLFNSSKHLLEDENDEYSIGDIKDYIGNKLKIAFVYELDGKVAGSVLAELHSYSIFICVLVVNQEYQNQGIGKKFLTHIEDYAKKRNIENIEMFVESNNKNMKNFVNKNKYVQGKKFIYCAKKIKK